MSQLFCIFAPNSFSNMNEYPKKKQIGRYWHMLLLARYRFSWQSISFFNHLFVAYNACI